MATLTREKHNANILSCIKITITQHAADEQVLGPSDAGFKAWAIELAGIVASLVPLCLLHFTLY